MNAMSKIEEHEILTARIRALQAIHYTEHLALINWGLWSLDRDDGPRDARPTWDTAELALRDMPGDAVVDGEGQSIKKGEEEYRPGYDGKAAIALDERMHGVGGLPEYVRLAVKTAYATREIPEYQFPHFAHCSTWDQFVERLEAALIFVGRWT